MQGIAAGRLRDLRAYVSRRIERNPPTGRGPVFGTCDLRQALLQCSMSLFSGSEMLFPWFPTMMLAAESISVIGLRVSKMALGGWEAYDEGILMISEKVEAAREAHATIMAGGSAEVIIGRYREHVATNQKRLSRNRA